MQLFVAVLIHLWGAQYPRRVLFNNPRQIHKGLRVATLKADANGLKLPDGGKTDPTTTLDENPSIKIVADTPSSSQQARTIATRPASAMPGISMLTLFQL